MKVKVSEIILDAEAQPRSELNSEVIQEYADAMKAGAQFPPVVVFGTNGRKWLADGWHRVHAAKVARVEEIEAEVRAGGLRDAVLFSCGANAAHGIRRASGDKRRAVLKMLRDPEWGKWQVTRIAKWCGVDHAYVVRLRQEIVTVTESSHKPLPAIECATVAPERGRNIDRDTGEIFEAQAPEPMPEVVQETTREAVHARPMFNRTNDNIDWAWWSWNPVTGCEFGCDYCYARDIANRFYPEGFKPTFHPERLSAPANTNPVVGKVGGRNVFVCSMADLFGPWVPNEWINGVMRAVEDAPQWNFLFLTKNPRRLASVAFPDNAWVGATVDTQARVKPAEDAMRAVSARVKWLSIEPMQERLQFNDIAVFDWIAIGGRSASTGAPAFQPEWEWVYSLTRDATEAGVKVYWKPNLTVRPQQYPES